MTQSTLQVNHRTWSDDQSYDDSMSDVYIRHGMRTYDEPSRDVGGENVQRYAVPIYRHRYNFDHGDNDDMLDEFLGELFGDYITMDELEAMLLSTVRVIPRIHAIEHVINRLAINEKKRKNKIKMVA